MEIHNNYLKLTEKEREFVDSVFKKSLFEKAKEYGIRLNGSDPCERAVEALATWVMESRKN